jgi:beta-glucanase (GH16 family)
MKIVGYIGLVIVLVAQVSSCGDSELDETNSFTVSESTIIEGNSTHTKSLIIKAEKSVHQNFEVTFALQEGHAKFNTDFMQASGLLDFSQNSKEATLDITIVGDTHPELNESFKLVITYHGTTYEIDITIEDDDPILADQILSDEDGFLTPGEYASMELVWSDEFDGASLSASDWTYELGNGCSISLCGWGNNELQSYTNSTDNVSVSNGLLTITARESGGSYTSGRIKTQEKKEFRFGRIDVRARLPKGQGIWPAIWMLGSNITAVSWPACGEIDIMELVGHQPAQVHGTVHYFSEGHKYSSGSTSLSSGDFSDQFHVFTLIWDNNQIKWYVDNKHFKTFSSMIGQQYPFNSNFFFILNVAVGGNWPGSPDETTMFPQSMTVDYIRVFR